MKIVLLLCALIATLQASPLTELKPVDSYPLSIKDDIVGDIWSDCSAAGDPAKIKSVVINPDPPKKGQPVTVNATITLSEVVSGGNLQLTVKYHTFIKDITVIDETSNLCDIAKNAGESCPLQVGDHVVLLTEKLPGSSPSGTYSGNAKGTDQSGKELVCINLNFKL